MELVGQGSYLEESEKALHKSRDLADGQQGGVLMGATLRKEVLMN